MPGGADVVFTRNPDGGWTTSIVLDLNNASGSPQLKSDIDRLRNAIRKAINGMSDLNVYFSDARTNAGLSLMQSSASAVYSISGVVKGLIANAARMAPALIGEAGSVPTGIFTESGCVAAIGTPAFTQAAQAATNARDIGAGLVGAQTLGEEFVQDQAKDFSGTVERILDPASNLAKYQIATGDTLSQQTAYTIKQMQVALRKLENAYDGR
jgi:hypothetical protein